MSDTPSLSPSSAPENRPPEAAPERPAEPDIDTALEEQEKDSEILIESTEERGEAKVETVEDTREKLEKVKERTLPRSPEDDKKPEEKEGKKTESVRDPWFPESVDPRTWSKKQIATLSTITVGAVGLFALWRWMRGKKEAPAAAPTEKKGFLRNWMYWIPGIGLAAVGLFAAHKMLRRFDKYEKGFEAIERKIDDWKNGAAESISNLGKHEGEKYGLTPEKYDEAETVFRRYPSNKWREKVAEIFGVKPDSKDEKYEKFMKDMEAKHKITTNENLNYCTLSVAVENYERDLESAVAEFGQWLKNHSFEILVGTVIATRLGILQAILNSGASTTVKAAQLGLTMTKWGIKHPLLSLFMMGGTIVALKKVKGDVLLPQNIHDLSTACIENKKIALGDIDAQILNTLSAQVSAIGPIVGNFGLWINEKVQSLLKVLEENVPEMIGLTSEEIIAKNNGASLHNLRHYIEQQLARTETDQSLREAGVGERCEQALHLLEDFETAFMLSFCTGEESDDPEIKKLREVLESLNITVTSKDGIIQWKAADMPVAFDLCVDPSVKNKESMKELSEKLQHGESLGTYVFTNAIDQLRERLENNKEGFVSEKFTFGNGPAAMIVGNVLYIVDDWRNPAEYFTAPLDLALDAMGFKNPIGSMEKSRDWKEFWALNVTQGVIASTLFSLNAELIAKIKQIVIGGGPLKPHAWPKVTYTLRTAAEITPGFSQVEWAKRIYGVKTDIEMLKKFGYWQGREVNVVCARAGIRAEWIAMIETTEDIKKLEEIGHELNVATRGKSILEIKDELRKRIIYALEDVRVRNPKDILLHQLRFFWGEKYGGAKKLYKDITLTLGKTEDLVKAGTNIDDLIKSGRTTKDLVTAGAKIDDLLKAGAPVNELLAAGVPGDVIGKYTSAASSAAVETGTETARTAAEAGDAAKSLDALLDSKTLYVLHTATEGDAVLEAKIAARLSTMSPTELSTASHSIVEAIDNGADAAKIGTFVDKGGDLMKISKFAVLCKTLDAVGVVGDIAGIAYAGYEMYETNRLIQNTPDTSEMKSKYQERYYYQAAGIGVGGVGLVAGGMALAGVGGAIATPVGLATLPVSAAIGAGYQWHLWEEVKKRSVEDWKREYTDPATLLADVRSHGFGEKVGTGMDMMLGDRTWWQMVWALSDYSRGFGLNYQRIAQDAVRVSTSLIEANEKRVRAVVEQTSTINVPTQVKETLPDGTEKIRNITSEEEKFIEQAAKTYYEAKVTYLMEYGEVEGMNFLQNKNFAELLQHAEDYGRLAHDRFVAEHTKQGSEALPKEEGSKEKQVKEYRENKETSALQILLVQEIQRIEAKDGSSNNVTKNHVGNILKQKTQPMLFALEVKVHEEDFSWWIDGDEGKMLLTYIQQSLPQLIEKESVSFASELRSCAESLTQGKITMPLAVELLQSKMEKIDRNLHAFLGGGKPRDMWASIQKDHPREVASLKLFFKESRSLAQKKERLKNLKPIHKISPMEKLAIEEKQLEAEIPLLEQKLRTSSPLNFSNT
jgi:hypothetical protein